MQKHFAILKFKNVAAGGTASVMVMYNAGKWAIVRLNRTDAPAMNLRDSPRDRTPEPRVDNITYGCGTYTQTDAPLVEISKLIKRYVVLPHRAAYGDYPADWMQDGDAIPIDIRNPPTGYAANHGFWVAIEGLWARMCPPPQRGIMETSPTYAARMSAFNSRRQDLLTNIRNRVGQGGPAGYAGLLASSQFVYWKNETYSVFGVHDYKSRFQLCRRVGALIAQCIRAERRNESYGVLAQELASVLKDHGNASYLDVGDSMSRISGALEDAPAVPVVLADCGHFTEAETNWQVYDDGDYVRWCAHCYNHDSVLCVDTQVRTVTSQAYWSDTHEEWYSERPDDEDDGREYEPESRVILDYATNVTRIIHADPNLRSSPYGDFLMGLELELTTGESRVSRNAAAKDIIKQLGDKYVVIKNDGSLPDNGFEIVTAPRGLAEHIANFSRWNINPDFRAWDTNQCGLHVHIHSRAFTEMTLGKFLMFINLDTNAPFIRKLAGRHPFKDTWAARYCAQEGMEVLENPKAAVKGKSRERYRMVNTQNLGKAEAERLGLDPYAYGGKYDTVELRVFKASLKKARLLAQIEFAHAAVMFCRVASYRDMNGNAFTEWLKPHTKLYPHLADWYGVRKSKAIKEAQGKALQEVCEDKVVGELAVPARQQRVTRRPPLDTSRLNEYLTPAARREAEQVRLREMLQREAERLRAARERARSSTRDTSF